MSVPSPRLAPISSPYTSPASATSVSASRYSLASFICLQVPINFNFALFPRPLTLWWEQSLAATKSHHQLQHRQQYPLLVRGLMPTYLLSCGSVLYVRGRIVCICKSVIEHALQSEYSIYLTKSSRSYPTPARASFPIFFNSKDLPLSALLCVSPKY